MECDRSCKFPSTKNGIALQQGRMQWVYAKCPQCGYTAHRDWNGSRNLMIRALQATAITLNGDAIQVGTCDKQVLAG